jgi:iron complex outermembrane receptor protein
MQSDSKLYGGEAGVHVHPSMLPWMHFESSFAWVIGKQDCGDYLPFIPAHKLNFELRGEKEKLAFIHDAYATIHAHYAFDQDCPAPQETATPGYSLYDLSIGGVLHAGKQLLQLSASVTNMLDKKYIDHLSTLKEVGGFNPGRNFILTLKMPFQL